MLLAYIKELELSLLMLLISVAQVFGGESLHQLGPCTCQIGEDKIVDLSPLAFQNNTPRFKDVSDDYRYKYSWNPCYDFKEGSCKGVAGCQMEPFRGRYFSLGSQESAEFHWADQLLEIVYHSTTGMMRTLHVTLVCTEENEDELVVLGERPTEQLVYDLTLKSPHACAYSTAEEMALSIGSIILITLALLLLVYVVAGVMFQVFVRKSSGVQVIPHLTFWSALPGLVKDGCLFVVKRGKTDQMYQSLK